MNAADLTTDTYESTQDTSETPLNLDSCSCANLLWFTRLRGAVRLLKASKVRGKEDVRDATLNQVCVVVFRRS